MTLVPIEVKTITEFHAWLKEQGLFRAYEEGRDLSIKLESGVEGQVNTSEQFWLRYDGRRGVEIYRDQRFTVRVWDSGLTGRIVYDAQYGAEYAEGQLQQALIDVVENMLYTEQRLHYRFIGDRVSMYVLTEIVS